jgi:hypothetical protein
MPGQVITTIPELQTALAEAIALEYATIPVYLSGWWTIKDSTMEAASLIHGVVIAEMRHMAVAANALIATGGTPNITEAVSAHPFPTFLPDGEDEFEVNLLPFGASFLQQAMKIEQPTPVVHLDAAVRERYASGHAPVRHHRMLGQGDVFLTIGQFYDSIIKGINTLVAQLGESAVFPNGGNTSQQFASFGGENITVSSSATAITLLTDTIKEGEGSPGTMWDENNQLSHFYIFQEISLGRAYNTGDKPGAPTGAAIPIPSGDQVFDMKTTPKMSDYPPGTGVFTDATNFNQLFTAVITELNLGFSGQPNQVGTAIGGMFGLPPAAATVLADPFPGTPGLVAGPTFELTTG